MLICQIRMYVRVIRYKLHLYTAAHTVCTFKFSRRQVYHQYYVVFYVPSVIYGRKKLESTTLCNKCQNIENNIRIICIIYNRIVSACVYSKINFRKNGYVKVTLIFIDFFMIGMKKQRLKINNIFYKQKIRLYNCLDQILKNSKSMQTQRKIYNVTE